MLYSDKNYNTTTRHDAPEQANGHVIDACLGTGCFQFRAIALYIGAQQKVTTNSMFTFERMMHSTDEQTLEFQNPSPLSSEDGVAAGTRCSDITCYDDRDIRALLYLQTPSK